MSVEAASVRKNKRIVEYIIGKFKNAKEAVTFGNTVEALVQQNMLTDFPKFKQQIGAPNTKLAITEDWTDETVLRLEFLGIKDQNGAMFICDVVKKAVQAHIDVHKANGLSIMNEVVREKPQPQFIG